MVDTQMFVGLSMKTDGLEVTSEVSSSAEDSYWGLGSTLHQRWRPNVQISTKITLLLS